MKATGIVRRIESWGIITPRALKPHKHWVFTDCASNKVLSGVKIFDFANAVRFLFCPKYFEKTKKF